MAEEGGVPRDVPFVRLTARRCLRAIRAFVRSEVGGRAVLLFTLLVAFLLAISALNVVNSYVGRDFMTAIEQRDRGGFARYAVAYAAVFAASTLVAVTYRFTEERTGLLWRQWLVRRLVAGYLDRRLFYRLEAEGRIGNPDQRIADDARSFVTMTLSLLLMFLNGTITVVAFSGVLWSISRTLFVVGVVYAAAGSGLSLLLGRPLVRLNYDQADREADLRSELMHVRSHAESIALLGRERQLGARLLDRLAAVVENSKRMIAVNRNLAFFTTGYNYLIQLVPALIVAPLFIRGEVEFGVISQSAMAFSHLLGAFSLIVTQIQAISSYGAVVARLSLLAEAAEAQAVRGAPALAVVSGAGVLVYEHVTLRAPHDGGVLVRDLSVSVPVGGRVLVRGGPDGAKGALFRATAGMWEAGEGRIVRPDRDGVEFLPERPYLAPGTLRGILTDGQAVPDERLGAALRAVGADAVLARAGGLDLERDWDDVLSLPQQQLVSVAHVLAVGARLAVLDRIDTALEAGQTSHVLAALAGNDVGYVVLSDGEQDLAHFDAVLALDADGGWTWSAPLAGGAAPRAEPGR
jgi:putative ATP-binding cassette transporter